MGQASIQPVYNASKGAVRLRTKAVAIQQAKEGIRVNSIHPGSVATPMTKIRQGDPKLYRLTQARVPLGRVAQPEEVACEVLSQRWHTPWRRRSPLARDAAIARIAPVLRPGSPNPGGGMDWLPEPFNPLVATSGLLESSSLV